MLCDVGHVQYVVISSSATTCCSFHAITMYGWHTYTISYSMQYLQFATISNAPCDYKIAGLYPLAGWVKTSTVVVHGCELAKVQQTR